MTKTTEKNSTRERIIAQAGRLAKKQGFGTAGVDALMAAADMKGGSFYYHFPKKEALLTAIIEAEIRQSRQLLTQQGAASKDYLQKRLQQYLSESHLLQPEAGCVLPALSSEVARANAETRACYADSMQALYADMEKILVHAKRSWPALAMCVGAVTMARAMPEGEVRDALLAECAAHLINIFAEQEN